MTIAPLIRFRELETSRVSNRVHLQFSSGGEDALHLISMSQTELAHVIVMRVDHIALLRVGAGFKLPLP
jgi:hypothetical protein